MIEIDGNIGEGGGQVLRSALSLSLVTLQAFRMVNVRARRAQPGLKPQHLQAVRAAAAVGQAEIRGAEIASRYLEFVPKLIHRGSVEFDIGTAGSAPLVLQTLVVPLSLASGPSSVTVVGGTHVPWSPCFHYLDQSWRPLLEQAGYRLKLTLLRPGFYPRGGGSVRAEIQPVTNVRQLSLTKRGRLVSIQGLSAVARLPLSIAHRQRDQALRRLAGVDFEMVIDLEQWDAPSPGTVLLLLARYQHSQCCFFALGARGKRAERVADEAVDAFQSFTATDAAIDAHLADQLLLPLALADGISRFTTAKLSTHLTTNAEVIRYFLPVQIEIEGRTGEPGQVTIKGTGLPSRRSVTEPMGFPTSV
jgi:RNA 3'-phosphate cyclase